MTETLKPCPFCGNQPESFASGLKDEGLMIQCMTDGCLGPHCSYIPPEAAIKAWNTRSPLTDEREKALADIRWYKKGGESDHLSTQAIERIEYFLEYPCGCAAPEGKE